MRLGVPEPISERSLYAYSEPGKEQRRWLRRRGVPIRSGRTERDKNQQAAVVQILRAFGATDEELAASLAEYRWPKLPSDKGEISRYLKALTERWKLGPLPESLASRQAVKLPLNRDALDTIYDQTIWWLRTRLRQNLPPDTIERLWTATRLSAYSQGGCSGIEIASVPTTQRGRRLSAGRSRRVRDQHRSPEGALEL